MINKRCLISSKGVYADFHRVLEVQSTAPLDTCTVLIQNYANEEAYLNKGAILYTTHVQIPMAELTGDFVFKLNQWLINSDGSPFQGGTLSADRAMDLDVLKDRKRAEITRARLAADSGQFIYQGKAIRTADKDMLDLLVTDARWNKGMSADWPGGWKAADNTYVPITTKEDWDRFFIAMYDQGIANFMISQTLKTRLDAAETAEDVAAIGWPA